MSPTDVGCTTLSENKKGFVKHTNERKGKKPKRDWGVGGFVEVGREENKTTTGKERRSREGKREREGGREKERGCSRQQNKKRKGEVLMEKISYIGWGKKVRIV